MSNLNIEKLNQIIYECMGESNIVTEDALDTAFMDLGCDSLAVMQVETRVGQEFSIQIPESLFLKLTPRQAMTYVNQRTAQGAEQQVGA